ncbi:restriction endonuclease subunit S [Clostridium perfringens]|uniref:restriction endonuclease subunit S n=1 Tax=Clostridium perfringens TaxID=1502 RepID=UPI001F5AE616|nr:restriction endonuclease subunit S [Clostridium perfringens]MCI2778630.1 restriction endonuclease subunit S [Clostridium perfringens]
MKYKISEICEVNSNNLSKKDNFKYIDYLDTSNLTKGTIGELQTLNLSTDKIPSRAKRKIKDKDILISTVRPNQKHYGIIKKAKKNLIASTGFVVLSANESLVDSEYLYRFLTQDNMTEYFQAIGETSTTAYPSIKPSVISELEINLPPLEEQKAIAKILSDLDEKIEVNNKINKNLEEIAQSIFKQWFVDFEFPNEEGKPYKSSGGEMVESELGMIPKGWNISELGELYEVKGGKRLPKGHSLQDTKTKYPYIRVTDVANGSIDKKSLKYIIEETREKIDKYNINYSDLYISIAGTVGIVGMINKSLDNASLTENMAKIKVGNIDKYYLYLLLNSKQGQETILSKVVGSTQPKLPLYAIKSIKILKGDNRINKKFYDYVNSLFMTRENNLDINEILEKLRDTLLPKLMSGEIRVPLENNEN